MSYLDIAAAKLYAQSTAALCKSEKDYKEFEKDIGSLLKVISENKNLEIFFYSPIFSKSKRLKSMLEILSSIKSSKLFKNFLSVLILRNRESLLPLIAKEFKYIYMDYIGEIEIEVVSVLKLSEKNLNMIRENFSSYLKKKVKLNTKVDKKILGGLIIRLDSLIFDASLSSKLNQIYYITDSKIKTI